LIRQTVPDLVTVDHTAKPTTISDGPTQSRKYQKHPNRGHYLINPYFANGKMKPVRQRNIKIGIKLSG
jgi:hypothetical protein